MDKVTHFEIPFGDLDRAKKFYADAFDWQYQDAPMGDDNTYTVIRTVDVGEDMKPTEAGAINGGFAPRAMAPTPVVVVDVPDMEAARKKVEAAGGTAPEAQKIGGMGLYTYATDSEGNTIGIWQTLKK